MTDLDVDIGEPTFNQEIVAAVGLKGFCVVNTGFDEETIQKAAEDASRLSGYGPPPALIVEGLLGESGSCEIAEMEDPTRGTTRKAGETLLKLDDFIGWVHGHILPLFPGTLGFECNERSFGVLHRSGSFGDEPPDLTEALVGRWLNVFRRHRLLVLMCLGQKGGVCSMRPFDGESGEEEVTLRCGQMLILRADVLTHTWTPAKDGDVVLSCWLLQPDRSTRGAFPDGRDDIPQTPVCQDLIHWANNRLIAIKAEQESEGGNLSEMDIPRGWKLASSHMVFKGVQVAVRGCAVNVAKASGSMDSFQSALSVGVDFGVEVPNSRWNHFSNNTILGWVSYNDDPDCWRTSRWQTNVRHAAFIDGHELFDNKFFNMSPMESKVTDPCQRMALEHAYEALHSAGYVRKQLMQNFIGVYQGHTGSDWDKVEHEQAGGCAGSYSPTIASNRINFALGLMGPSFTIDTEGAASLSAIFQGCNDIMPSKEFKKPLINAALAGGVTIMFAPYWWPIHNQYMNPVGRVFAFDAQAAGYIKGEGSGLVVLKRHGEMVEGQMVLDESMPNMALVPGFTMVNSGRAASLTAPSAPALQQVVGDAVRHALLSPLDVDAVECDAKGSLMHDAVEVVCMARQLRGVARGDEELLSLGGVKTKLGYTQETAGVASFIATMLQQRGGSLPGNLHLKTLNPHAFPEDEEAAVVVPSEALCHRCRSSFVGVMARGFGGTHVHTLLWTESTDQKIPSGKRDFMDLQAFNFWPGGGGELEDGAEPLKEYMINGSWSGWKGPERMRSEGTNCWSFTVTMGENRFEEFQIWCDGDSQKVLHPGDNGASSGAPVYGPKPLDDCQGRNWRVDARPAWVQLPLQDIERIEAEKAGAAAGETALALRPDQGEGGYGWTKVERRDEGVPGDQYHVRLRVAGKWRTVVWERITQLSKDRPQAVSRGSYYIAATWNGWAFDVMDADPTARGVFRFDFKMPKGASYAMQEFKIVRNCDWGQAFYPYANGLPGGSGEEVLGPDGEGHGLNFLIDGASSGPTYRIEFQRAVDGDEDVKSVSWRKLDVN